MAAAIDQGNIGTAAKGSGEANSNLVTFNTTAAVAAGAMIVIAAFRFNNTNTTLTASGGSLTWAAAHNVTSGTIRGYLFYAFAPSGLASGTALTVTASSGSNDWTVCAASYAGLDSADALQAVNGSAAGTAAWATGTIGGSAGDAYIGFAAGDGTLRTSTTTAPAVERIDFNSATTAGSITLVDELEGEANDALAGTWSGTLGHVAVGAAFKVAGGGGEEPVAPRLLGLLGVGT